MEARSSGTKETLPPQLVTFDAILPAAMALRAEENGVRRAAMDPLTLLVLSVLGGAFISFGAIFATTVSAGSIAVTSVDGTTALSAGLPYGIVRLLTGLAFTVGLILVVVGGAELFTGNNLIVMAWASGKVTSTRSARELGHRVLGQLRRRVLHGRPDVLQTQYTFGGGSVGLVALTTAHAKTSLAFVPALTLGIMCNALVCLAIWMCYSARTTDRPDHHDRSADRSLRCRRLRAQHRQHLLHPDGPVHQGRRARFILGVDRQDGRRFSESHLGAISSSAICCRSRSATSSAARSWSPPSIGSSICARSLLELGYRPKSQLRMKERRHACGAPLL